MMSSDHRINEALDSAWHRQSAASSLERWIEVCDKENWGDIPENLPLLISIFGASWYFTRYIFFRGKDAAQLLDSAHLQDFSAKSILDRFAGTEIHNEPELKLEELRLLKNEVMLQILACYLSGHLGLVETERALTHLADACLSVSMKIFELDSSPGSRLAAYGMGRMAGNEMTFGSDLDLIFIFEGDSSEEVYDLSRKVRALMRNIGSAGSAGSLYDIDMRLRPHGTSGALLTTAGSFLEYHKGECEIWERQMMTRCRPIVDEDGLGSECLEKICPEIYADYELEYLRQEIITMRKRVQDEKGNISGKYEIKRGRGGIMDIDFLTHFYQLGYGKALPELRTGSTRSVLEILAEKNLIKDEKSGKLLDDYNFLKMIEASIRLFDMKSISAFPRETKEHIPVAAAMGYPGDKAGKFVEKYIEITREVRKLFTEYLGGL